MEFGQVKQPPAESLHNPNENPQSIGALFSPSYHTVPSASLTCTQKKQHRRCQDNWSTRTQLHRTISTSIAYDITHPLNHHLSLTPLGHRYRALRYRKAHFGKNLISFSHSCFKQTCTVVYHFMQLYCCRLIRTVLWKGDSGVLLL